MKGKFIGVTTEGTKICHEQANDIGRDVELEGAITKLCNLKMRSRATNGGFKQSTYRVRSKAELAMAKCHHQNERRVTNVRPGDGAARLAPNFSLDFEPRRAKGSLWRSMEAEEKQRSGQHTP